jgi:hypothetical protein
MPLENEKNNKEEEDFSWERVEKYLAEKTNSGNALAIIETEKIFQKVLEKLNCPGKTIDQKVQSLKSIISNYDELTRVRKIYQNLLTNTGFALEKLDVKKILAIYYMAIEDITKYHTEKQGIIKKTKLYLNTYLPAPKKLLKNIGIGAIIFFFIIFLLDSTDFGRSLVGSLIVISHFIFSWVLFTVLLVGGIIIIIIGSFFYFESRKKKKSTLSVED